MPKNNHFFFLTDSNLYYEIIDGVTVLTFDEQKLITRAISLRLCISCHENPVQFKFNILNRKYQ